jgi:flagellar hook-associated protein FlgK
MSELAIGLSGLTVALKSIETVGNNIANAATEGYHRQEVVVAPVSSGLVSGVQVGAGAQIVTIRRLYNAIVENEILRQEPALAQVAQELETLQTVESILGSIGTAGLASAIDEFFSALTTLATQPENPVLRDGVVWAADAVASHFHNVGQTLERLAAALDIEVRGLTDQVNVLTAEIADLNGRIREMYYFGSPDNNLLDRRDQAIRQLTELLTVEIQKAHDGTYTIISGGTALVVGMKVTAIESGTTAGGDMGISVAGAAHYDTQTSGGRLGGVLALQNFLLPGIQGDLDDMAAQLARLVNAVHAEGIGQDGSFEHLEGWAMDAHLADWRPPITAGELNIRLTDTTTGQSRLETISIDPASDTLADVAARLDAIAGIAASVVDSRLVVEAEADTRFDFVPALLPQPATSTLTGTAAPTLGGTYTGGANDTLTFTVVGDGEAGVTPGLVLEVTDAAGAAVASVRVGQGYAAGDALHVTDGVTVSLSSGTLVDGETFTVRALARADATGFLAAAGLNAFFKGASATEIEVLADLKSSSSRLATSRQAGGQGNAGAVLLAAVGTQPVDALGGVTLGDHYRRIAAGVGQQIAGREARREGLEYALRQLENQRAHASGVDINEEAAKLIVFEQLFQSMARYLATIDKAYETLFGLL